jgi:phosphoglycolate phosphatase-like HAD superfamily hydrolase
MSSYSAFHAFALLATWWQQQSAVQNRRSLIEVIRDLATILRADIGMDALLHDPEPSLRKLAYRYAIHHDVSLQRRVAAADFLTAIPGLLAACEDSFRLFSGAEDFLIRARASRTAFGIFTATAPEYAVQRMIRAGENPELIQEIWSRSRCEDQLAGHFDWRSASATERAFLNLLRPYKDSKPHPGPLRAVHEQYELAPESVLMIGEGCADLGCVLEHPEQLTPDSRLYARFAFQKQGAALTEQFADINAVLRDGHPLGLRCFDDLYPNAAQHPGIIVLEQGFQTLLGMVANGLIVLKPTPPPTRESDLAASGYRRSATRAPQRTQSKHPIEVDDDGCNNS